MVAKVVHLKKEPYDVRIDRSTIWGNPFIIGVDGTREEVVGKYDNWIHKPEQEYLRNAAKRVLKDRILGCWCAPKLCHGNILLNIANED